MDDLHRQRQGITRKWLRSLSLRTTFGATYPVAEMVHVFPCHRLLPLHMTGHESRPYLDLRHDEWETPRITEPVASDGTAGSLSSRLIET